MNSRNARRRLAALGLALSACLGCGKTPPAPDPAAAAAEASEVLAGTEAEVQETARSAAQSAQAGQVVEAWAGFASLAQQPALTAEQRAAAQRAAVALLPALNKAAEGGDPRARALIEEHRRTK